jgi:hypothetical protein
MKKPTNKIKPGLTVPRDEIEANLKERLLNYQEIAASPFFKDWLTSVFSVGWLGFDNIDAYDLVKGKTGTLFKASAKNLEEIKGILKRTINRNAAGVIVGAMVPASFTFDDLYKIQETIVLLTNERTEVLIQAAQHKGGIRLFMLVV